MTIKCKEIKPLDNLYNHNVIKANNLNSPKNNNISIRNLDALVGIEIKSNKNVKNNTEKRRISEDQKNQKIDESLIKKKSIVLAIMSKDNLLKKTSNEKKITMKNLSGNSNHLSTNNSSINSFNASQKQFAAQKSVKKTKN